MYTDCRDSSGQLKGIRTEAGRVTGPVGGDETVTFLFGQSRPFSVSLSLCLSVCLSLIVATTVLESVLTSMLTWQRIIM